MEKKIELPTKVPKQEQDSSLKYLLKESDDNFRISSKTGHIILWFSVAFLIIMFIWAYFAVLDEVTTAQGKVIPSQKTKLIQNLEGGLVKDILVHEGQIVNNDQILMRLSEIKFSSSFREGKLKEQALEIKIARLKAELNNEPFHIAPELAREFPELVASEQQLYDSRKAELQTLYDNRELLIREMHMTKPLLAEGAVSEVEVLHLQQRINDLSSNIAKFRSAALQELNIAKAEESRTEEGNRSLKDQLARTEVRSPVKGIVKQIYVTTVGGVVKPGMPLMEIVPLDDTLLVEAHVKPKDIGFLHPGQDAMVKISAYDFSIYGGLDGKVEHISADTTTNEKGNSFYEVWVRTQKNYLQRKNGDKLRIIPGMQATIDVLTGHKSVLNYLMKPILKTKQEALRER
jgi:adhesin transport system membrane fusion protein